MEWFLAWVSVTPGAPVAVAVVITVAAIALAVWVIA